MLLHRPNVSSLILRRLTMSPHTPKPSSSILQRLPVLIIVALFASADPVAGQDLKTLPLTTESQEARTHFLQGLDDVANVFVERAAFHFDQAVKADENFALARYMHARTKAGLSTAERLDAMNEEIARLASASTEEILFALVDREDFQNNDATALTLAKAAAKLLPDDPYVANNVAFLSGPFQSAEQLIAYKGLTTKFPDFAPAYNNLAYTSWSLGDEGGAVRAVKRYMELSADHPNSHDSYAEIMQFRGMYDEALAHYAKAVELDADYVQGYMGMADVHLLRGDVDKARAALEQAVTRSKSPASRVVAKRAEASTYFLEGNDKEGIKALLASAQMAEDEGLKDMAATSYWALAVAEAIAGDKRNVEKHLVKAEALNGESPGHMAWSAYAYGMAGDAPNAHKYAAAYEESQDQAGEWGPTMHGLAYLAEGNLTAAEEALLQSGLQNPVSRSAMARLYRATGRTAEADLYELEIHNDREASASNMIQALTRLSLRKG